MSIDRELVGKKFYKLIESKYEGKHKDLLLYLTPIIFENNPALNCKYKCNEKLREKVPDRRRMKKNSNYGMAIGNLTAQAGSNLNLGEFDSYVINELKLEMYIRYVDDIVIVSESKEKLINSLPLIEKKLEETHQRMNRKKTKIGTAYQGIPFLGKVSYPYGYQKPTKQVIVRVCEKARKMKVEDKATLLSRVNAQMGCLKNFNCIKLMKQYEELLSVPVKEILNSTNTQ